MNIRFKRLKDIDNRFDLTGSIEEYFTGKSYEIINKSEPYRAEGFEWVTIDFPHGGSWRFQTDWIDNGPIICYDDILNLFKEEL